MIDDNRCYIGLYRCYIGDIVAHQWLISGLSVAHQWLISEKRAEKEQYKTNQQIA